MHNSSNFSGDPLTNDLYELSILFLTMTQLLINLDSNSNLFKMAISWSLSF
jgi:hypothetical protein